MFLFTYSFFIALYILGTLSSFQNDESDSYQVPTPDSKPKKEDIIQELRKFTDDFFDVDIEQEYGNNEYFVERTEQSYPSEIRDQTNKTVETSQEEDTSLSLDFLYRIHDWENYHI
ncbi:uncharacterized protein LOC126895306 [Daktulosphaira vitifoliae]|uniref:uncharacterized protein LOC126895306 n=1 Tax=Daktulosphaira vitifoliae TaxID=58002 RepID=UPI0021A9DD1D|nr:uncharacterized protein LOC126895306 [Daktulosphaira vitifoliae]